MADSLDSLGTASPQSALDFAGLGALRGKAQQKSDKATRETATQFEAMFIQEMLKSMRATVEKDDLMGSDTESQFQDMYDRELSMQMARRNTLGVADMLVKAIDRDKSAPTDFKAKAEPMPLNTPQPPLEIQRSAPAIKLVRPDKFNIDRNQASPVFGSAK
ncbi:MAG: Peptidoglycan hydrolase FlgJ [Pseudomonadota bacterium]|jgi:Rod binding domain-containing protein